MQIVIYDANMEYLISFLRLNHSNMNYSFMETTLKNWTLLANHSNSPKIWMLIFSTFISQSHNASKIAPRKTNSIAPDQTAPRSSLIKSNAVCLRIFLPIFSFIMVATAAKEFCQESFFLSF